MSRFLFLLISVLCVGSEISGARTLYVAQTGDGSTGTDWPGAFRTINQALTASASGEQIWVASGTYNEHIPLGEGVVLYGGFAGTEATGEVTLRNWNLNQTTIFYDKSPGPGVVVIGADHSVLDGFRLTTKNRGKAVLCQGVEMKLANCTLVDNYTDFSAGAGARIIDSTVELTNCQITNNQSGGSAGASIESSSVTFRKCTISGNVATGAAGGIGGIDSEIWMENCRICDNDADVGGGLFLAYGSRGYLKHCTFDGNTSNEWDDELMYEIGEGIYLAPVNDPEKKTTVELENCILWDTWGVKKDIFARFLFVNSDVVTLFDTQYASITNRNSISQLPEFVDPANGNYHLKSNSPCIDSGTETTLTKDLEGNPRSVDVPGVSNNPTAFDMGCYEFQLPRSDLNGDGKVDARDLLKFQEEWMREGVDSQE